MLELLIILQNCCFVKRNKRLLASASSGGIAKGSSTSLLSTVGGFDGFRLLSSHWATPKDDNSSNSPVGYSSAPSTLQRIGHASCRAPTPSDCDKSIYMPVASSVPPGSSGLDQSESDDDDARGVSHRHAGHSAVLSVKSFPANTSEDDKIVTGQPSAFTSTGADVGQARTKLYADSADIVFEVRCFCFL